MIELKSTGELFLQAILYLGFAVLSFYVLWLMAPYYWIQKHGGMAALIRFFSLSESRLGYDMTKYAALFATMYVVDLMLVLAVPAHSVLVYPASFIMALSGVFAAYAIRFRKETWAQFKSTAVEATFEAYP